MVQYLLQLAKVLKRNHKHKDAFKDRKETLTLVIAIAIHSTKRISLEKQTITIYCQH